MQRGEAAPGEVISINMVSLKGGVPEDAAAPFADARFTMNLQPATAEAGFDMRLPPMSGAEMDRVERMIREEWAPSALNFSVSFTIQARAMRAAARPACARAMTRVPHVIARAGEAAARGQQRSGDVHRRRGEPLVGRLHRIAGGAGTQRRAGDFPSRHRRLVLARAGHPFAGLFAHAVRPACVPCA
jgi:hypothetical protein